jgi:hypothetical protein
MQTIGTAAKTKTPTQIGKCAEPPVPGPGVANASHAEDMVRDRLDAAFG